MSNEQQQQSEPQRPGAQPPNGSGTGEPSAPSGNATGAQPPASTPSGSPDPTSSEQPPAPEQTQSSPSSEGDTFPREYVEELRSENARYRTEARAADALAQRLHVELVRATGRLADPTDLPFDAAHLDDPDALVASIERLTEAKPHLKARRIVGDVGQGERGAVSDGVNLLGMLRSRA